jgi:hypothetical protein
MGLSGCEPDGRFRSRWLFFRLDDVAFKCHRDYALSGFALCHPIEPFPA